MDERIPAEVRHAFRKASLTRRGFLRMSGGAVAGAAVLGTTGCGIFGGEESGQGGGKTLLRRLSTEVRYFDSALATDERSFEILLNGMDGLYRLGPDDQPQPAVAETHEVSEDELTYTFTLREGVKWSNGDTVTSQDFKFAWLRALDPDTASEYAYIIGDVVKGATEFNSGEGSRDQVAIETPDERTLKVTLVNPTPYFLSLTAFTTYFPQNEAYVREQGEQYAAGPRNILYNGPFVMQSYDPAAGGTMVRNDQYWDRDNVAIERIEYKLVKELNTALQLYESDQLHLTEISGDQVARFKDDPEFWRYVAFTHFFGVMNQEDPVMANKNIRKAMMIGFDRNKLTGQVLQDGSEPAFAFVPPGMAGPEGQTFREAGGNTMLPQDPGQAKQFWDRGVQELGRTPQITLLTQDSSTARDIITFVQQQYREHLGIEAEIDITTFENALDRAERRDYQISFASGWGADYGDPMTFLAYFLTNSGSNRTGFSNARYDQLVKDAQAEADEAKRMRMMLEAEKILFDEAVLAPEYFEAVVGLKKPFLKDFTKHPYGPDPDWKYASLEGDQ
ncbi:peptide ABC transporter substrate-binding protein [Amycolatopsis cihanbeyliensis]|uniref:Oligopeptide transport system substrate-binding protein n=1 Tax=Amycolatopsis cihanbeyliensis TaxID=1128664 RepID=A0A542DM64_AMYCI|nr:peptide ABC transporter substrate-binding protein [Amycolatopsis cihanbeyliensis]TQJ04074.1 oligopeptide transport system substrate-binding protein [Amycolatopsis cihanbeyliensis]